MTFDGIDYFSKVWLNGTEVGSQEGIFGGPTIDISQPINYNASNKIVVEVRAGNWGKITSGT